jgi:predicted enzyme related to lactoylglutathione lyase
VITWFTAFLDLPADRFDEGARFWSAVTGWRVSDRRGERDEFATLIPSRGDSHLKVQAVDGPPGSHLDVHVTDLAAGVARVRELGGEVRAEQDGYTVMASPGGFVFCVVPHATSGLPAPPSSWPGGRSSVEQLCIDAPPAAYDREADFWTAFTGFERDPGEPNEFENLDRPAWSPLRFLLQRLESDAARRTTAHLDIASDDRAAEIRRHEALGAEVTYEGRGWTTMRDPVGSTYCVTDRVPAYDLPPSRPS